MRCASLREYVESECMCCQQNETWRRAVIYTQNMHTRTNVDIQTLRHLRGAYFHRFVGILRVLTSIVGKAAGRGYQYLLLHAYFQRWDGSR